MHFKAASLPDVVLHVVRDKGTEQPFTGEYDQFEGAGSYLCRQCGLVLFRANAKFPSGCGWPSFDEEIMGTIKHIPDKDGMRTEILCARCDAHLGHIFHGERLTVKNLRYCVNSLSLDFIPNQTVLDTEEAIFAAGCFWGVEYYLKRLPGVLKTQVGYTGGKVKNPTYEAVCSGNTGHVEAIRVLYDPKQVSFEQVAKCFFETHDFTQVDGQGPDRGEQYLSVAFYYNPEQRHTLEKLIKILVGLGYPVATHIESVSTFWPAEAYHQDYYQKTGKQPYCHHYEKKF